MVSLSNCSLVLRLTTLWHSRPGRIRTRSRSTASTTRPGGAARGDPPVAVIHVVAEHAATSVGNLDIRLDGHGLKDDGAWALAGAIRAGGGGGALKRLSLASNGLSGDGALCATLSGATRRVSRCLISVESHWRTAAATGLARHWV